MTELIEYAGNWYVPGLGEKPFRTLSGIIDGYARPKSAEGVITVDAHRSIKLKIHGNFFDTRYNRDTDEEIRLPAPWLDRDDSVIIVGALYTITRATLIGTLQPLDPGYITLYKAKQETLEEWSAKGGSPISRSCEFSVEWAFFGPRFESREEVVFQHLSVRYPYVNVWLDALSPERHLNSEASYETAGFDPAEITATFKKPDPLRVIATEEYEIWIDIEGTVGQHSYNFCLPDSLTLTRTPYVHFKTAQAQPIECFERLIRIFAEFFSFVIGRRVSATNITDWRNKIRSTRIYNPDLTRYGVESGGAPSPYCMLTDLTPVSFAKWLGTYDSLRTLYALYFSATSDTMASDEYKFLTLAQALEGFHRITAPSNKVVTTPLFRELRDKMLEVVPTEHKEWMESKLAYANQPSLKLRLEELIQPFSGILQLGISNTNSFVASVVRTRNNLTHPSDEDRGLVLTGSDLQIGIELLRMLFELCILRYLDVELNSVATTFHLRLGHQVLERGKELFT